VIFRSLVGLVVMECVRFLVAINVAQFSNFEPLKKVY
jgi:hypothetical protein